jgi:hypothetical protein
MFNWERIDEAGSEDRGILTCVAVCCVDVWPWFGGVSESNEMTGAVVAKGVKGMNEGDRAWSEHAKY